METKILLTTLKNKIWIIICVSVLAGILAFILTNSLQKEYKSRSQISVMFPEGNSKKTAQDMEMEIIYHVEAMKTEFIGLMVSYDLLKHDLENVPFRKNDFTIQPRERKNAIANLKNKLDSFDILSPYKNFEYQLMDAIERKNYNVMASRKLRVDRVGNTNFIYVEFVSENPSLSAFVVNSLSSEYIRYHTLLNRSASDSLIRLAKLVEHRKNEWRIKSDQLNKYRANRVVNEEHLATREKLENQLAEEKEKMNESVASLQGINDRINAQRSVLNESTNGNVKSTPKVTQLQTKINELSKIYADQGSKNKELASTITNLRKQLQTELARLEETNKTGKRGMLDQLLKEKSKIESNQAVVTANLSSIQARLNNIKRSINEMQPESLYALESGYANSLTAYVFVRDKYEKARARFQSTEAAAELKLAVMGHPNSKAETVNKLFIIFMVMIGCAGIAVVAILLVSHFHKPRTPDPFFVVLR